MFTTLQNKAFVLPYFSIRVETLMTFLTQYTGLTVIFSADQKCAYAHHGSAAPASACRSARDRVASIVLVVHALMCRAANHARSHAAGRTTAPVVTRVANLIAHHVVQAAARSATAICHTANQTVARVATRHAASQTAALVATCHAANKTALHAVNQTAAASSFSHAASSSAAQPAAPAPCRAAPAATPAAVARGAAHASQAAAVLARNTAAAENAASAPAASVASSPSSGRTCSGAAAPASSASSASRRAAKHRRRAASASHRAARVKMAAAAAGGRAAVFQSRRAPGARAGAFGRAGSVQKGVDALGAGIRAVPPDACVEVELDVLLFLFLF